MSTNNKLIKTIMLSAILGGLLCGCGRNDVIEENTGNDTGSDSVDTQQTTEDIKMPELENVKMPELENVNIADTYAEATYVLDALADVKNDNVIYSPMSLHMALGVLNEGANGETKSQIDKFLGDGYSEKAQEFMNTYNVSNDIGTVNIANAIWVDKALELKKEYKKSVKERYQAGAENCDFTTPSKTAKTINDWCAKQTNNLIDNIIDESAIAGGEAAAIITNTVYFNQQWSDELYEIEEKRDFNNADGSKSSINYLSGSSSVYYENDDASAFSYDYMNGFHFIGILPKAEGAFKAADIDVKSLLQNEYYDYDVDFYMPSLNYETDNDLLKPALSAMGLRDVFDASKADLSGISDNPLYVGDVVQKCNIRLDKYGTEASAATALEVMMATAAPFERIKKEVKLDRPYLFLIMDPANEEILFAGKVDFMSK